MRRHYRALKSYKLKRGRRIKNVFVSRGGYSL